MTVDATTLEKFRRSLLLGTGKQSAPDGILATLSLAAMLGKFERAPLPKTEELPGLMLLPARYPGIQSRKALDRLLSGPDAKVTDMMASAVPGVLQRIGLELHPFDFARLEDFIVRYSEQLSPAAREWLRIIRPEREGPDEPYLDGPVTEEHLAMASKGQRIAFLRDMRARDPEHARTLIVSMMTAEPADMRFRLLQVIAHKPTVQDQSFLESLLKDRAPTVKELAQSLLGRIPGSENFALSMARLKEDLHVVTEGILRRRKIFVYNGLEPKPKQSRFDDKLAGLSLADIAGAFGEEKSSIIAIAMQSDKLLDLQLTLIGKAIDDGDYALVTAACEQLNSHDGVLLNALIDDSYAKRKEIDGNEILGLCFTPSKWKQLPNAIDLANAAARIPRTLPEPIARDLIQHPHWTMLEDLPRKATLEAIAHLIPVSSSADFIQMAESHAPRVVLYHRFIQSLS